MPDLVLGLDGFKKRWLGVSLVDGVFREARVYETLAEALSTRHRTSAWDSVKRTVNSRRGCAA